MTDSAISAWLYDGATATRHAVTLNVQSGLLTARGEGLERVALLSELTVSERLGNARRFVHLRDGSAIECADAAALGKLLAELGYRDSWVVRAQMHPLAMLLSVVALVTIVVAGYVWGLPWAVNYLAPRVPEQAKTLIDESVMAELDARWLEQSELDEADQARLRERFAQLMAPAGAWAGCAHCAVEFRSGKDSFGPNAFALPGGTIVVFDELVELMDDDDRVLGVLAHEAAHVIHDHGLRQMLQASIVGAFLTWYVGDVSVMLSTAPAVLLKSRYSREFENEADRTGIDILAAHGLSAAPLADALEKLLEWEKKKTGRRDDDESFIPEYLSTHPDTLNRIRTLRALRQ